MTFRTLLAGLVFALGGICLGESPTASFAETRPRLVVVVVVDQLPEPVLERLAPVLSGGFKTFLARGVQFRNAHHDHALTKTAPGHFALLAGRHPGPAAVAANEFYDPTQKRFVYCVEDTQARIVGSDRKGKSYGRVESTALGDWLKKSSPASMVYSVAAKDRAAVLMGGKHPDGSFWFDPSTGDFTTSTYYADTLPDFVRQFNARRPAARYMGKDWDRMLKDEKIYLKYAGVDDAPGENVLSKDEDSPVFPHRFPSNAAGDDEEEGGFGKLMSMPWMEELTLDFARHLVKSRNLGTDDAPDLLCVSHSSFDIIGHTFGPHSQEVMDAALRIDRMLGEFIKFVEETVGADRVVWVLSSDHGAQPLVEWALSRKISAGRVNKDVRAFRDRLFDEFRKQYEPAGKLFLFRGQENIVFDRAELARRNIAPKEVYGLVRTMAAAEPWIARVFDRDQLLSKDNLGEIGERMRHSFHPQKGADIYFIPKPYHLTPGGVFSRRGTSHGTPYDYDSRVPLIFVGAGVKPAIVQREVRTIDLAPTLAEWLNVPVPKEVDGKPLEELISNR